MSRTNDQLWRITTATSAAPNGQLQAYRSQKIGDKAILIKLDEKTVQIAYLFFLALKSNRSESLRLSADLFMDILTFRFDCFTGENGVNILDSMQQLLPYAFTTMKPFQINTKEPIINSSQFFPLKFHPDMLVQAVLHGDEAMLINMLKTNPDLTQAGEGIDFSGRQFQFSEDEDKNTALTAIQTAIACGDFAANKNSTGLCELLFEALQRQHPDRCYQIFHDQALALYTKSLRFYAKKQSEKIHGLYRRMGDGEKIDLTTAIKAEEKRLEAYDRALHSKNLKTIIEAHTNPDPDPANAVAADAQKDHVIQINPLLITTLEKATDVDIQAILDNPMIDSPLNNLLREFRAEFIKLSHEEIIFNPQHLINIFALYNTFYARVAATDQNWMKCYFFWDHLVEFAICDLPACKAQIFANPGLYDTVENGAKNLRVFDYRHGGGSIFPPLVSPVDPHNKKLASTVASCAEGSCLAAAAGRMACMVPARRLLAAVFQNLCRATTSGFQNLLRRSHQHAMRAGV